MKPTWLSLHLALVLVGSNASLMAARPAAADPVPSEVAAAAVPRHQVVADDRTNPARRIVDVQIERRLEEVELLAVASRIARSSGAARTHVNFHLTDRSQAQVPWAVVRLPGEPRVQFIGLRLAEAEQLIAEVHADRRRILGAWLTASPLSPGRFMLVQSGPRILGERRLRNGITTTVELVETRLGRNRKLHDRAGSDEFYVLTENGDLEVRSATALLAVAEKIPPAAERPVTRRDPALAVVGEPASPPPVSGQHATPAALPTAHASPSAVTKEVEDIALSPPVTAAQAPAEADVALPMKAAEAPPPAKRRRAAVVKAPARDGEAKAAWRSTNLEGS